MKNPLVLQSSLEYPSAKMSHSYIIVRMEYHRFHAMPHILYVVSLFLLALCNNQYPGLLISQ